MGSPFESTVAQMPNQGRIYQDYGQRFAHKPPYIRLYQKWPLPVARTQSTVVEILFNIRDFGTHLALGADAHVTVDRRIRGIKWLLDAHVCQSVFAENASRVQVCRHEATLTSYSLGIRTIPSRSRMLMNVQLGASSGWLGSHVHILSMERFVWQNPKTFLVYR